MKSMLRQSFAGLRILIVLSILLGVAYPLFVYGIGQLPGLSSRSDGSLVSADGHVVGSRLLGQNFTGADGRPLPQYFQPRPSDAGTNGYDPTHSGASNLGPEDVQDTPSTPGLLTQVCTRSLQVGRFDGVDGARPYCTSTGVGAVLRVLYSEPGYRGTITAVVSVNQFCPTRPFLATYDGVRVTCAARNGDYARGRQVLVRGDAPADPAVPADAVTASGSGLDPDISPAYAAIQVDRVARTRHLPVATVRRLVARYTQGRTLGFMGEPTVDVLQLNLALDRVTRH